MNAQAMAGPQLGPTGKLTASGTDTALEWLVTALVSAKFYLLLSFLFGYSFTLQRADAERSRAFFAPRHLRRSTCLFLLGLAHGVLLFPGDILTVYAVLSLVLFALRDITPRAAIRAAIWLIAGAAACLLAWGLLVVALAEPVSPQDAATRAQAMAMAYRGGTGAVVQANMRWLRDALPGNVVYTADMQGAFLIGLAAGQRGLLVERRRHCEWMRQIVVSGLLFGLTGSVFMAVCRNGPLDARWYDVGSAVGVLTAPVLTATYACGLLLMMSNHRCRRVTLLLAPVGRLALTNYLAQSLVMAVVFTSYGLAWRGRFGTTVVLTGCLVLWAAQLATSSLLLKRYRYGPAEWLLRAVTLAGRPKGFVRG
ncbi:DUF418 domain-containing protein [Streptomyces sp. NRRL S-813]|uniref:DUF418 domain-containing protein n=1 Tax=Streptomyces sp. NRRL S-813 TaxID=1463919 RepID=UPI001F3D4CBC|nr:DUF418 domain-containing protein [Streptomyces sp. NRRL S-813]